jgi:hypothetical protein
MAYNFVFQDSEKGTMPELWIIPYTFGI